MDELDTFRKMLWIDKHRLDDELEIQPQTMMTIVQNLTSANGRLAEAKESLSMVEGRLTEEAKDNDPKATVAVVEAQVRRHRERRSAYEAFQVARHNQELWAGMLEAWKQRGYSLKTLADLFTAQYFAIDTTYNTSRRNHEEARQDELRRQMRTNHTPLEERKTDEGSRPRRRVST